MIGFKVFRNTPTSIDLNGPILSFLEQPVGIATIESTASFTGIVTSTPVGTGHLSYQWYEVGVGAIGSASTAEVGIGTTLTLTGLVDPDDTGRQFYLESSYVASAYGVGLITAGTARSTGNALNAPFNSNIVGLAIDPSISITSQPGIASAITGTNAIFNITATTTNYTDDLLSYRWQENGSNLSDSSTVTGSATTSLTISSDTIGVSTIRCVVSHPNASNSPLNSNTVDFNVVVDGSRKILYVEEFDVNATLHSTQEYNLVNEDMEIIPDFMTDMTGIGVTANWNRIYSIYAPERDVDVRITLEAAAGAPGKNNDGDLHGKGGAGGVSTWNMTLTRQQEYVVNLGAALWPSGGESGPGLPGGGTGGGGSFFYRGGELLVACGGGGGGDPLGGNGNKPGQVGQGGGIGPNPTLTPLGEFPGGQNSPNTTAETGGRVSSCTIGDYWANQGIAPCASIGSTTFFTGKDGQKTVNMNGATVTRGYKAGLNYQFNGGNGTPLTAAQDQFLNQMNTTLEATSGNNRAGGGGGAVGGMGGQGGNTFNYGRGGVGFDGLGNVTGTAGGNLLQVGVIKIEAV